MFMSTIFKSYSLSRRSCGLVRLGTSHPERAQGGFTVRATTSGAAEHSPPRAAWSRSLHATSSGIPSASTWEYFMGEETELKVSLKHKS